MEEIVVYEKPTCSKCRVAMQILNEQGVPYRTVRYHDAPLTKKKLAELLRKIGISAKELLRKEDPVYRALKIKPEALSEDEIIELMIAHPDLMQRPILERGAKAIVGRPSEKIFEFLNEA